MLFADWALGLTHSIRAIKGHCSTGGEKTCFVGIPLNTQSVHKDSQKHTWHTKTPRHPDTKTHTLIQWHANYLVAQRKVSNFVSHIFLKIHHIFHEIFCPPGLKGNLHTPVSLWQPFRRSLIEWEPPWLSSFSTFHCIPLIALALNYAVKFALKNTLFSSWRQNMNNRILEVHQVQYIVVM